MGGPSMNDADLRIQRFVEAYWLEHGLGLSWRDVCQGAGVVTNQVRDALRRGVVQNTPGQARSIRPAQPPAPDGTRVVFEFSEPFAPDAYCTYRGRMLVDRLRYEITVFVTASTVMLVSLDEAVPA